MQRTGIGTWRWTSRYRHTRDTILMTVTHHRYRRRVDGVVLQPGHVVARLHYTVCARRVLCARHTGGGSGRGDGFVCVVGGGGGVGVFVCAVGVVFFRVDDVCGGGRSGGGRTHDVEDRRDKAELITREETVTRS